MYKSFRLNIYLSATQWLTANCRELWGVKQCNGIYDLGWREPSGKRSSDHKFPRKLSVLLVTCSKLAD